MIGELFKRDDTIGGVIADRGLSKLKMAMKRAGLVGSVCAGLLGTGTVISPPASAYDMDCAVILCLAGGFPTGCADAYGYMINRITRTPPLPPFGYCAMSDGSEYTDYDVSYSFPDAETRNSWACPGDSTLRFSVSEIENDDRITRTGHASCSSSGARTNAMRVHFLLDIVMQSGTDLEARYTARVNFSQGLIY